MKRMPRRQFLLAASALAAAPLAGVRAQAKKPLRVVWFSAGEPESHKSYIDAFRSGLRELGYRENQDVVIDYRWRGETIKPYRWMAADIVEEKPDVIVATCEISAKAALGVTDSIPIVMAASSDPVAHGLVKSLARPERNLTGLSFNEFEVSAKRLELLREVVPGLRRVGAIMPADESISKVELAEIEQLARAHQIELVSHRVPGEDFEAAFAAMREAKVQGILDFATLSVNFPYQREFTALALASRIPVAYNLREMVEAGGLMSYGPVARVVFRRAAYYVDRIAKGTSPDELPIEQPSRFETAINLDTARRLGITFPQTVLLRADTVIG
ncbi:MAG TPA: ABC transporter substrate-binding protein [Burkholderiales bacterium]|nr:ABC transporter substrate-binding protein [Burkholderiales bacterium]